MALTSSYRRRTAGFTALFAALLLVLTALFAITPANANPDPDRRPCDEYGYEKFNSGNGSETLSWGSMKWGSDAGDLDGDSNTTELSYEIDAGYTVKFCIKAGNVDNTFSGSQTGSGYVSHPNSSISHVGYKVVGTPDEEVTPDAPTFTDPTCENNEIGLDVPADTDVIDYTVSGDQEPGGTVTVTADLAEGFVLADGAKDEWTHTYGPLATDCEEPTAVTPDEPTFTDPTCDVNTVGLDVPADTDAVTYTVSGDQEPGGTVTVTADLAEGFVLADGAKDEWVHTYGPEATNCGGVDESVVDPAASVSVTCEAATIHLDNTASTEGKDVTYTITGVEGYDTVVVEAGTDQTIDIASTLSEDVAYDITVSAEGMDDATAAGTYDCVDEPETDVSPDEVEKPAPNPTPAPTPAPAQPAAQAAAQDELPATGLGSTELLLLALLMLGLGTAALLASDPRRQN